MAGVWAMVPGRSATEALCLLAMHHLEADGDNPLDLQHVEVGYALKEVHDHA